MMNLRFPHVKKKQTKKNKKKKQKKNKQKTNKQQQQKKKKKKKKKKKTRKFAVLGIQNTPRVFSESLPGAHVRRNVLTLRHTVFDLITAHTLISVQSKNSVVFRLQPMYFFLYLFTKAHVVGTHLNCTDLSMQFMSTHNICIYKENQKTSHNHH